MAKITSTRKQKIKSPVNDSNNIINQVQKTSATKATRTRKSAPRESPSQRSSIYRGVTRHRWTGRYEAHLWDKDCWNNSQKKKGKQVYLGAYDDEATAARAYDLAALKYWGEETILNFPLSTYENDMKEMEGFSREEYIGSLRRKSSGFSRGVSKYRGVARHHHNGRWEARIGRVFGNKYLYLGTYATQEEAATAYDIAAIEYRGLNAVTNFDLSRYIHLIKPNNALCSNNDQQQQPISPSNIVETIKLLDSNSPLSTTSSSSSNLEGKDMVEQQMHDDQVLQVERGQDDVVSTMWENEVPYSNDDDHQSYWSSTTLLEFDQCQELFNFDDPDNIGQHMFLEGEGSCSDHYVFKDDDDDDDFFSELSSFLCDLDVLEDEQIGV